MEESQEEQTGKTWERNTSGLRRGPGTQPAGKPGRKPLPAEEKRRTISLNVSQGDRAVMEALAEYWSCSLSEALRTMLRHFETTFKLDVRR